MEGAMEGAMEGEEGNEEQKDGNWNLLGTANRITFIITWHFLYIGRDLIHLVVINILLLVTKATKKEKEKRRYF